VNAHPQRGGLFRQTATGAAPAGAPKRNFLRFGARRVRMRLRALRADDADAFAPPPRRPIGR
jgi:hypothetical protein